MAIPTRDALLVPWANNFTTRINTAGNPYALPTGRASSMTTITAGYVAAYNALMDARADGTKAESQTAVKDTRKGILLSNARELYALISANSSISNADKILAGVHVREGGNSPVPAPTARPGMDIRSVVGRNVELNIHDSSTSTKRGKPVGAVQALVYYFAGENYPSDPNGWSFAGTTTKAKFTFAVPDSVPGGTLVWVCAAWTNRAGEPGPVNVPISTNIQGGGVSAAGAGMKIAA